MSKLTNKEEVVSYINKGWELGSSENYTSKARVWLQELGLCNGGPTVQVHMSTMKSLLMNKVIEVAPRQSKDSYWLTRYKISEQTHC